MQSRLSFVLFTTVARLQARQHTLLSPALLLVFVTLFSLLFSLDAEQAATRCRLTRLSFMASLCVAGYLRARRVRALYLQAVRSQRERAAAAAAAASTNTAASAAGPSSAEQGYVMKRLNPSPPRLNTPNQNSVLPRATSLELLKTERTVHSGYGTGGGQTAGGQTAGGQGGEEMVDEGGRDADEELSPLCIR
jgi:hypothetical protein